MSYVVDRRGTWRGLLARPCPTAITILCRVCYRIPVIAHVDKASAANRGPLSRLSYPTSGRERERERITIAARSSSPNNVGAFRTRRGLVERLHVPDPRLADASGGGRVAVNRCCKEIQPVLARLSTQKERWCRSTSQIWKISAENFVNKFRGNF